MKAAIRYFAMTIVFIGAAAASMSSSNTHRVLSNQSATAKMPVPMCAPGLPTCPELPPSQ